MTPTTTDNARPSNLLTEVGAPLESLVNVLADLYRRCPDLLGDRIESGSVTVYKVGQWYARHCACGQIGWVSIYPPNASLGIPQREAEALRFITRRGWECAECAGERREIERERLAA